MLSDSPFISVIMPVYNGDDYFEQALKSVLKQTWPHFEAVVIDDGSRDPRFVERLCLAAGSRVTYRYQENTGVAGALNHGIRLMHGDVFCWLSHDDLFHPDKLERQVAYHKRLGNRDAILFCNYNVIDSAGVRTATVLAPLDKLIKAPQRALLNGCINGCTIYAPAHIMKLSPGFDLSRRYTQDYYLWNKLLKDYDFFLQPDVLVDYRVHPSQGSNTPAAVAEAEDLWITMAEDRSEFERVAMYGSTYQFFAQLADHLAHSPYRVAEAHLRERAAKAVASSLVSVILTEPALNAEAGAFLTEHLTPLLARCELIWCDLHANRIHKRTSEGIHTEEAVSISVAERLNRAAELSSGDYVAFARSTSPEIASRIAIAVVSAHQQGATIGLTNLPAGTRVTARDLLIEDERSVAYGLHNWFFHRMELLRAPPFSDTLLQSGEMAMLAALIGPAAGVGLYNANALAAR